MRLNLPNLDALSECRSLLIAGMGGGFDIYGGLPIYLELRERGVNVHLASLTFSQVQFAKNSERLTPHLVGIAPETKSVLIYFPEMHLVRYLQDQKGIATTVWCFAATGAQPLLSTYRTLAEHLNLDGILLIDGGVDSLMRGDEAEMGTVLEDCLSLAAVNQMEDIKLRQVVCLGFGAEGDVDRGHALENIAALTERGAFLGSCALVPKMPVFQAYQELVEYAHSQRGQDPTVIQSSVVAAAQGRFGNYHATEKTKGSRLHLSPLMPIYWFFDLPGVAAWNPFLPDLARSETYRDAMATVARWRALLPQRAPSRIVL